MTGDVFLSIKTGAAFIPRDQSNAALFLMNGSGLKRN